MNKTNKNLAITGAAVAGAALAAGGVLLYMRQRKIIPDGAAAVTNFKKEKYLGKWYEIARLPMFFEKNLQNAIAEYSMSDDGSVRVVNSGFNVKKQKWTSAEGRAKFVKDENTGMLEVSFFGPFYAGYNVIEIDPDYQYVLVAGRNLDYMWILSRKREMPEEILKKYLAKAQSIGYDTSKLIWTEQTPELT